MTEQEVFELMTKAVTTSHGIEIRCDSVTTFQNHFYKLRKEHDVFSVLKMRKALTPNHLWLTHERTDESNS